MKLYIDDIRNPKHKGFDVVRSSKEAINYIIHNGCPEYISFDHDLGEEDDAMFIVYWLIDTDLKMKYFIPKDFAFNVHSANPVGKKNIEDLLNRYLKFREENS